MHSDAAPLKYSEAIDRNPALFSGRGYPLSVSIPWDLFAIRPGERRFLESVHLTIRPPKHPKHPTGITAVTRKAAAIAAIVIGDTTIRRCMSLQAGAG